MTEPTPLQFSLKTILAITAAFAFFFAAGSWFGLAGYVGVLAMAALFNRRMRVVERLIVCLEIIVLGLVLAPATPKVASGGGRHRAQCTNNLKQIGLALHNYYDVYGSFPPVCISDGNGKPMHSWRVLILPFVEQQALYERYDFNEPWDGPKNSRLANEMPAVYRCPSNSANPGMLTDYVAIVGPETIWQPDRNTTFDEIADGSPKTVAVVEAADLGVNWMAPRDLPFSAVANGINPKQGPGMASGHPGVVIVLFADGHVQTIQQNISGDLLQAICTKAGDEEIDENF